MTLRLERILCPTDFTPFSSRALEYAIALARPFGSEIVALNVILLPLPSLEPEDKDWIPAEPGMRAEILHKLEAFTAPARAAALSVRGLVVEGDPSDEILRQASALRADIVVMGSHGRRGFGRWLLGSHAERVLRLATCPVLIASGPSGAATLGAPPPLQRLLCAVSGAEHSRQTLDYAQELAARLSAHLTLLHVNDPRRGTASLPRGVGGEILDNAAAEGAQVIVVGAHDRGAGSLGFLGSTSDHVVREARCGVLAVKAAAGPRHGVVAQSLALQGRQP
jgi:nucleotide-binding universal stress UspA family protein